MSLSRQGAFIRLLAYQWIEGKLPADVRQIGKMCDISPNSLVKMWEQLDHFFPLLECKSARANPRLAAQRKALEEKRLSLSAAGKKGAEKTWGGHRPGHGTAVAVAVSSTTAGTGTPRQNTENLESPATPAELKPIFDRLRDQVVDRYAFEYWIAPLVITHGDKKDQLIIWAVSSNVSVVASQYTAILQEATQHVLGVPVQLDFKVMP